VAGTAGAFQRGKFPELLDLTIQPGNAFLESSSVNRAHKSDNAQPAWVISRNPFNIASASEHRQPVFLHPRNGRQKTATILETEAAGRLNLRLGACRFRLEPLDYKIPNPLGFAIHSGFAVAWGSQSFLWFVFWQFWFSNF